MVVPLARRAVCRVLGHVPKLTMPVVFGLLKPLCERRGAPCRRRRAR